MRKDCGRGNRYFVLSWPDLPQNLSESNTIAIFCSGRKTSLPTSCRDFFTLLKFTLLILFYTTIYTTILMLPASLFSGRIPETSVCELKTHQLYIKWNCHLSAKKNSKHVIKHFIVLLENFCKSTFARA